MIAIRTSATFNFDLTAAVGTNGTGAASVTLATMQPMQIFVLIPDWRDCGQSSRNGYSTGTTQYPSSAEWTPQPKRCTSRAPMDGGSEERDATI
jgi:hypothetical protein